MQRTVSINLTGTYQNLKTLVDAAVLANGEAPWDKFGYLLSVYSPRTNASGTRIQLTSDLVNKVADKEILVEASDSYSAGGASHNSIILSDKLIRILAGDDSATTGTGVISLETA